MPTGFQSFNDSGTVQIDENYSAVCLRQAPVIQVPATYDVVGIDPLLFIGQTGGTFVTIKSRINMGNNVWRYIIVCDRVSNIRLYIFDKGPPTAGNSGLQVFNAASQLVYDSSSIVMNIANIYETPRSSGAVIQVPQDGRSFAASLSYTRRYWSMQQGDEGGGQLSYIYQESLSFSGGQINTKYIKVAEAEQAANTVPEWVAPPQVLLINVTNI